MMDKDSLEVAKDLVKEVGKAVYNDGGKPIVEPTGELIGLIPRAIKAALLPLEKWIISKEYNLSETKLLLNIKLENINPENIEPPETHIAVPALQYISYCMDNIELRNMYANLLAASMNKVVKNGVHPAFVEIIKQLCPNEAKILKYLKQKTAIPIITLRYEIDNTGIGMNILEHFSNVGEKCDCEPPIKIQHYFDNFNRLGITYIPPDYLLTENNIYEELENHPFIKEKMVIPENYKAKGYKTNKINKKGLFLTAFGKEFCKTCID
ncbi:conserved hypothetical protein [Treponema primitia ZAS-2]|uniref:DUF4393 domain-containing protein n=1 Tax=Treponema primitia (strain ATCC BAA-887 / DSM 12427 / ZAS-2) TaxID=545694 RepID=D8L147_TREPZ|nr:DUF4393 domain-containing protein [Treponema primitia]ADJ19591.1 hypothetical protein [Treponema primitia ZAS-2]AEF85961.1 conserved hypothetical protein [Treponema primitia ZAS-2]